MELGKILDSTPEPSLIPVGASLAPKGEYYLPAPMTESQRTLTDQVVSLHYSDILKLFETSETVMQESLDTLYTNSQLVASHPYLLVDQYEPHNLLLKEVPAQLARESGKFGILGDIIDLIKDSKKHIALVARPGKCHDLIEAYILGKFVNYRRYSGSYLREPTGEEDEFSTIHLIPSSNLDPSHIESENFDVIIAFDQTFSFTEPHITKIINSGVSPVPVVRLVPLNSVEHISLKFQGLQEEEFLRKVLAAVVILRWNVGTIPVHLRPVYHQKLKPLAEWFNNTQGSTWLMPDLPKIEEYSASDVEESLLKENKDEEEKSQVQSQTVEEATPPEPRANQSNGYYKVKRIKRETDYVTDHIEDTTTYTHNQTLLTHNVIRKLNRLTEENSHLKEEIESYKATSSRRQEAFEVLTEEMGAKIRNLDDLENRMKFSERKAERLTTERDRALEKVEQVNKELEETRQSLQQGPPDAATLDEQRRKIGELEGEIKKLNDKLDSRNTENEYMREEYQKASSAAADAHAQIKSLKDENADLEKRADGEAIRLRALTFDEERSMKDDQIKELKSKIELLEEHLKRMMDSEKQISRSRLASRANSSSNKMSRTNSPIDATNK